MTIEQLSERHWSEIEAASVALNGQQNYRDLVNQYDAPLTFTRQSINGFDRSRLTHWRERGEREFYRTDGRIAFVIYRRAQALKGQRRIDLAVIDCGEFRAIIGEYEGIMLPH